MKLNQLLETEINGNYGVFREGVKKLSKLKLLDLIELGAVEYGIERKEMIIKLRVHLQ